jgi:hypothetical protein
MKSLNLVFGWALKLIELFDINWLKQNLIQYVFYDVLVCDECVVCKD